VASAEGYGITESVSGFKTVETDALAQTLREMGICHVSGEGTGIESLRFYHVTRDKKDIYLFSNEDVYNDLDATVKLEQEGECLIYDPWDNKCYRADVPNGRLVIKLEKGNMLFVIFGDEIPQDVPKFKYETARKSLSLRFNISVMDEGESEFRTIATDSECFDVSAPDCMPYFSGSIRYETDFVASEDYYVIDLGQVGEVAEVWLNGKYLGARINAPYKFNMAGALKDGKNKLEIIVKSNLAHRRRDDLSSFIQIPPTGIIGDICVCKYGLKR
jgi:hypothetical protein